ncbi:helix-turn-helix domain-containing protein [Mesonia sp. HuA40]|uniref:helix-turn-helix domain-containing protein n=1 Tax=Mesonia sp. HuA40 TaxID=2602761 RepID=UPI0011C70E6E|nr:helix-turn-helix transcriptional regulator [Mesonia sp. HuA40]TXK73669.1 helix-turn-helix transcriptional regulator [Mesonia sp. HuA40]
MTGIGKCIRALRQIKGYSQEYMAIKLHMSQSNYAKIEKELINISTQRLKAIAAVLEVSMHRLLVEPPQKSAALIDEKEDLNLEVMEDFFTTKVLYEKIIEDKDKEIAFLREEIMQLRTK